MTALNSFFHALPGHNLEGVQGRVKNAIQRAGGKEGNLEA